MHKVAARRRAGGARQRERKRQVALEEMQRLPGYDPPFMRVRGQQTLPSEI
jgi:hypothetical protein